MIGKRWMPTSVIHSQQDVLKVGRSPGGLFAAIVRKRLSRTAHIFE